MQSNAFRSGSGRLRVRYVCDECFGHERCALRNDARERDQPSGGAAFRTSDQHSRCRQKTKVNAAQHSTDTAAGSLLLFHFGLIAVVDGFCSLRSALILPLFEVQAADVDPTNHSEMESAICDRHGSKTFDPGKFRVRLMFERAQRKMGDDESRRCDVEMKR